MDYLTSQLGYVIDLLVGHSRGSVVGMLWLCKHRDGAAKSVRGYVNVSGRYRMEVGRKWAINVRNATDLLHCRKSTVSGPAVNTTTFINLPSRLRGHGTQQGATR